MGDDLKKDIKKLTKHLRKFGKKFGDKGTYKERVSKHIVIEFYLNDILFKTTFPNTPSSWTGVKGTFNQIRKNLKECGIEPPQFSRVRLISSVEEEEVIDEIYEILDQYE